MRIMRWVGLLSLFAGGLLSSCSETDSSLEPGTTSADSCHRTVLVYMLGSNSLSSYIETNISAMKKAVEEGALHYGNLLLYIDRYNAQPTLEQLSLHDGEVERTVIQTYENDNSATVEVMSAVCADMEELYPADSYGLILWSHANGWYPKTNQVVTRSFGDDDGEEMDIDEVASALPDSLFDFILCDACYMGAVEVAYEWRKDCRYYIASPATIMGVGFPYEEMLPHLFSCDSPIPENLVEVCKDYMDFYRSYDEPYGTISLTDTRELDALSRAMHLVLAGAVDSVSVASLQQYSQERSSAVSYQNLFFDLDDFVQSVAADSSAYAAFTDCLSRAVLYADATEEYPSQVYTRWLTFPIKHYSGLSVYVPGAAENTRIDDYYRTLSWYGQVYEDIDEIPLKSD
ncbi:MAG: clostripain-related cysteine peptidase [Porphyromonadaceae bacterium]|nr:clostripain-related cysteine peptidase [Porphyromonadaceae bacterium]